MKQIPLTKGFIALVDDSDYERLAHLAWHVCLSRGRAYAVGNLPCGFQRMHRFILDPIPPGSEVDHFRHYPLSEKIVDNRRDNLRLVTNSQNLANKRKMRSGATSIFKGFSRHRPTGKWRAQIQRNGRNVHLGLFMSEAHAAYAYDLSAVQFSGEHALTNFPVPNSTNWMFGTA